MTWITNNPEAAKALQAADTAFDLAKAAASNLPLAEKVAALRTAKTQRQAAYDAAIPARRTKQGFGTLAGER